MQPAFQIFFILNYSGFNRPSDLKSSLQILQKTGKISERAEQRAADVMISKADN
jgi:hypothetical protein